MSAGVFQVPAPDGIDASLLPDVCRPCVPGMLRISPCAPCASLGPQHASALHILPTSFLRVGAIIMTLHDVCDVLLEASKLAKYTGHDAGATALFTAFALSWAGLRLAFFPFVVIHSTRWPLGSGIHGFAGAVPRGIAVRGDVTSDPLAAGTQIV